MQQTRKTKFSAIDQTIMVSQDIWAVSLIRRQKAKNPEHAYLLIEGLDSHNQGTIARYDLVISKNNNGQSEIIMHEFSDIPLEEVNPFVLEDLIKMAGETDKLYYLTWNITQDEANRLKQDVEQDKANPPQYNQSGDKSLFSQSLGGSGHSCFTWARAKLLKLNNPDIDVKADWTDYVIAVPSHYLTGGAKKSSCLLM